MNLINTIMSYKCKSSESIERAYTKSLKIQTNESKEILKIEMTHEAQAYGMKNLIRALYLIQDWVCPWSVLQEAVRHSAHMTGTLPLFVWDFPRMSVKEEYTGIPYIKFLGVWKQTIRGSLLKRKNTKFQLCSIQMWLFRQ